MREVLTESIGVFMQSRFCEITTTIVSDRELYLYTCRTPQWQHGHIPAAMGGPSIPGNRVRTLQGYSFVISLPIAMRCGRRPVGLSYEIGLAMLSYPAPPVRSQRFQSRDMLEDLSLASFQVHHGMHAGDPEEKCI